MAPVTTEDREVEEVAALGAVVTADPSGPNGLAAHSHVGGKSVAAVGGRTHLHPVGSADLADHPAPSGREEAWRFTPLRRLRGLHEDAELDGDAVSLGVELAPVGGISAEVVTGEGSRALVGSTGYRPTDRPSARAYGAARRTVLVDVPAETVTDEAVSVAFHGVGDGSAATAGHVLIRVGPLAQAKVVLTYRGTAVLSDIVEVIVGDGAQLELVTLGDWSADAVHLSHQHLTIGRDATIKQSVLTFGGDLVRVVTTASYQGPGGNAELFGVYFADAGQHLEHRLFVDHSEPHCRSNVLYKGALQGKSAHTVWIGDVLIRRAAEGTDTYEMNRNLALTEGARADSVPNLEIETGEIVGAGHASSTGRFDDEQLFYLLSRGIPEPVARRLVVRGFFGEVLQRIGIPAVVEQASAIVERELALTGN